MIMLEKPRFSDADPTIENRLIIGPQLQAEALRTDNPIQEGEFVILKDDPNAATWYDCAEVRKILADRIEQLLHNIYASISKLSRIPHQAKGEALEGNNLSQTEHGGA